jgi:AraC-like DNA-binding protein
VHAFRRISRTPLVRAEVLLGCREAAVKLKADVDPIFAEHGIEPRLLDSPSGFIEKPRLAEALQAVSEQCHCTHLGFLVGKYQPPMKFGPATQLLYLAPSIRGAMENAARFVHLYTEGVSYELAIESEEASFRRKNTHHYKIRPSQLDLLGMVQVFKMLKSLCGESWRPSAITFDQPSPRTEDEMTDYFDCPAVFDCEYTGIVFPKEDLARQLPTANTELLQIVEAYFTLDMPDIDSTDDIVLAARDYIGRTIGTGVCDLDSCARQLGMHPRKLQRNLLTNGFKFKQLMLDKRMELARGQLRDPQLRISQLADVLGYENPSAFTRAFTRVHGLSPNQWRKAHKDRLL